MPSSLVDEAEGEIWSTEKNHFFDCLDCERMTWVLYPACSMACAPKGHSLQGLRIRFCSNVFWRVKQQIWYSREVFSKPRLYSHLNTSKKAVILRIYFEHGLFHRLSHSWLVITCTNRIWPDLISPWRIDNGKLYRATLTPWGWCWPGAGGMPGYYSLSDSLGSSCVFPKWRPSGFVKIGKKLRAF